jgi:hypothetical protein
MTATKRTVTCVTTASTCLLTQMRRSTKPPTSCATGRWTAQNPHVGKPGRTDRSTHNTPCRPPSPSSSPTSTRVSASRSPRWSPASCVLPGCPRTAQRSASPERTGVTNAIAGGLLPVFHCDLTTIELPLTIDLPEFAVIHARADNGRIVGSHDRHIGAVSGRTAISFHCFWESARTRLTTSCSTPPGCTPHRQEEIVPRGLPTCPVPARLGHTYSRPLVKGTVPLKPQPLIDANRGPIVLGHVEDHIVDAAP